MAPKSLGLDCVLKTDGKDGPIKPLASSLGMNDGNESDSNVVVIDMLEDFDL